MNTKNQINWRRKQNDGLPLDEQDAELAALVQLLSRSAQAQPDPQFHQNARSRLLQKLPPRRQPAQRPSALLAWFNQFRSWWENAQVSPRAAVAWLLLICFVIFTSFSSVAAVYASANALPGHALYTVKVGVENWQLRLVRDDAELAHHHLAFADRRMVEIDHLLLLGEPGSLQTAVDRYIYHANEMQTLLTSSQVGALTADMRQTFVQNELLLAQMNRRAQPESWPSLIRAATAANHGRQAAQATLIAAADPQQETALRIQFAGERLVLAEILAEARRTSDLNQALADYSQQIDAVNGLLATLNADANTDAETLFAWETAIVRQQEALEAVAQRAPVAAGVAVARARQVSQRGRQVVEAIRAGEEIPPPSASGRPEDRPGGGPPTDRPGGGPPEDRPGGGPPADRPGGGPPADRPGGGPPDDRPGNRPND